MRCKDCHIAPFTPYYVLNQRTTLCEHFVLLLQILSHLPPHRLTPLSDSYPPPDQHLDMLPFLFILFSRFVSSRADTSAEPPYSNRRHNLQYTGSGGHCSSGSDLDVTYHGGTLMTQTVKLYNIYIGHSSSDYSGSTTPAIVGTFAENLGGSRYGNIVTYYHDSTKKHPKHVNNTYTFEGDIYYSHSGSSISDTTIADAINFAITTNAISPDSNDIFAVFFRGDYSYYSEQRRSSWLVDWCGIHGSVTLNGYDLVFLALGDPSFIPSSSSNKSICAPLFYGAANSSGVTYSGSSPTCNNNNNCSFIPPNGNAAVDAMISVYASMIFETLTDTFFDGYYRDCDGAEIADLCYKNYGAIQTSGSVNFNVQMGSNKYLVQQQWLYQPNGQASACALGADVDSGALTDFKVHVPALVLLIASSFLILAL